MVRFKDKGSEVDLPVVDPSGIVVPDVVDAPTAPAPAPSAS